MSDLGGGLWGVIAVLAALARRNINPQAQHVEVSLLDGLMALFGYLGQLGLLTETVPERVGSAHHSMVPYGRFEAKDCFIVLAVLVGPFWGRFAEQSNDRTSSMTIVSTTSKAVE